RHFASPFAGGRQTESQELHTDFRVVILQGQVPDFVVEADANARRTVGLVVGEDDSAMIEREVEVEGGVGVQSYFTLQHGNAREFRQIPPEDHVDASIQVQLAPIARQTNQEVGAERW